MAKLKTQLNDGDVEAFLNSVENDKRREDSFTVLEIMKKLTGEEAKMWGLPSSDLGATITNTKADGKVIGS